MNYNMLIIEDSEESKELIKKTFEKNYAVSWANNLESAKNIIAKSNFEVILLDVNLPDGNGFNFYTSYLTNLNFQNVIIIFITANNQLCDKVLGLTIGADDYITKPFQPLELKARVDLRVLKSRIKSEEFSTLRLKNIEINKLTQKVFLYNYEGVKTETSLTNIEFKVLFLFMSNESKIFSRQQILDKIWGLNAYLTDRCVDTHIHSLRKKIRHCNTYIQSVYGAGYRFCAN